MLLKILLDLELFVPTKSSRDFEFSQILFYFLNQHAIIITTSLLAESFNSAVLSSGCTLDSLGSF